MPSAGEPLEAQEREERLAERRLADPDPAFDRVRHLERAQRGLELSPLPLDARADEEDLLGLRPGSDQLQHLVGDELERAARARPFEETDRSLELRRRRRPVDEEVALEVGELRRRDLRVARRELFDPTRCQRAQVLGRARQRLEWSAIRLVRERDHDLGAAGERFEQRPLRAGQVLEAVGEHGPVRPGPELARDEVGRVAPAQVSVPEPELLELGAVGRVEEREIAAQLVGLDEPRLELGERGAERVREAGEARRGAEPVQRRVRDRGADDQLALGIGRDRAVRAAGAGDLLEDVVEGSDLAREQRTALRQQLSLDALDVRPVRHDQDRISFERAQIALEEQGDFARVRGPGKQRQPAARGHRPIVDLRSDGFERRGGSSPEVARKASYAAAAVFGLRPRLAAARPGIWPAQLSQRSACFEPRRASV